LYNQKRAAGTLCKVDVTPFKTRGRSLKDLKNRCIINPSQTP
jgi:hypothetical protein